MDPLSHAALGRTLVAMDGRQRLGPGATLAAVLGALAPDVDAVLMPVGWDIYLRAHEIGTHTIAGAAIAAFAAAGVSRAIVRTGRYACLSIAAVAGAISHVGLDVLSGARIRIAWPIIDAHASLPLVAMADPWLVAMFGLALMAMWIARERRPVVARGTLMSIGAFLLLKGAVAVWTIRGAHTNGAETHVIGSVVEAKWGSLIRWNLFDSTSTQLRQWRIDARDRRPQLILAWPVAVQTSLVSRSRRLSTVKNFLRVHDLGFAVEFPEVGGTTRVLWSDIRYCWDAGAPGAPVVDPIVTARIDDHEIHISCALWFGGVFTTANIPSLQVVQVGRLIQTRGAAP